MRQVQGQTLGRSTPTGQRPKVELLIDPAEDAYGDVGSSVCHVLSQETGRKSVGSAASEEPAKRNWGFARFFGMRFEKQEDPPQVLVSGCLEETDYSQDPNNSPEIKARSTRGSFRFLSRQKSPALSEKDAPAERPLRRARSTLGFFTGTLKAKSLFKRGNIPTSQNDQNVPTANDSGSAVTGSDTECELPSTFAPIHPAGSPAVQSTRSLEETRGSQEFNEQTRDTIIEESKGLAAPAHGLSRQTSLTQRLRNYFHKNKGNIQYRDLCRSLDFLSVDIATLNPSYFKNFDSEQKPKPPPTHKPTPANTVSHSTISSQTLDAHVSPGISDTWMPSPSVDSYESLASEARTAVDEDFGAELCRNQCLSDGNSSLTLDNNTRLLSWLSYVASKPLPPRSCVDLNIQAGAGNYAAQQRSFVDRQALQQELFAESLMICPNEFPIAARRIMSGGLHSESPPCLAPLPALSLQGH